jgi:hypothetical protein
MFSSNIIVTFGLDWRIQNPNSRIENESKNTHKLQHARFFSKVTPIWCYVRPLPARRVMIDLSVLSSGFSQKIPLKR